MSKIRKEESDDWRRRFWSRDDISDDEFEENVENVRNVKKSSTVLTRRRMPDGIGILRLSFSSPGYLTLFTTKTTLTRTAKQKQQIKLICVQFCFDL